jgi:lipopolysaccharide/colanic/teichoic acid biosynthesis glycosyltransferase
VSTVVSWGGKGWSVLQGASLGKENAEELTVAVDQRLASSFALSGNIVVDVQTREVVIDLRGPDGAQANGSAARAAKTWLDTPAPTVALGRRAGRDRAQRAFDLFMVVITAPVWVPLLLVLMLLVKCTSRGPVFYVHERIGRFGNPLHCPKLRTMVIDADRRLQDMLDSDPELRNEFDNTFKLRRDPRVTKVGRILRITGLDELPQLWCVVKGSMSLVGPRPIVEGETEYFGQYLAIVQRVRPGLTGLWQVSGRNDIPYPMRVAYDVQYVLTRTLWSDIKILFATLALVIRPKRRGAY